MLKNNRKPNLNVGMLLGSISFSLAIYIIIYYLQKWSYESPSAIVSFIMKISAAFIIVLILAVLTYIFQMKKNEFKITAKKLDESEKLFRAVFDQSPVGIAIISNHEIKNMNHTFERIIDRSKEEMSRLKWLDITHPEDIHKDLELYKNFIIGKIKSYEMDKRYIKRDGSIVWVHMIITSLQPEEDLCADHLCILIDITDQKLAMESLYESERSKAVLLSHLPGLAYRCLYDRDWTMQFLSDGCEELTGYKPASLMNNNDLSYNQLIAPEYQNQVWSDWNDVLDNKRQYKAEYEIITAVGTRKWVMEIGQGIYDDKHNVVALEGIVIDITDAKKRLLQIEYMNDHDFMTDLFNRKYYEEKKAQLDVEENLPLAVIMTDINGLRLINDSFGHNVGDKIVKDVANILKKCIVNEAILARTGGDDFSLLLPNTDLKEVNNILGLIKHECDQYNYSSFETLQNINLSIGFSIKSDMTQDLDDIEKEAEDYMIKRKLLERNSYHSSILSTIMATLYTRSAETEEHAERIAVLSKMIGEKLELPKKSIDDLQLFGMLHDIGKIGIEDAILNKPEKLSDDEWNIMKRHSELGYRIAMANPELESIAECILSHHERWDGKGYPRGLQGETIPLLSRILAVVDAYDAMTENRVYREAISSQQALDEIKRHIGTQFDPVVANIFLEIILST